MDLLHFVAMVSTDGAAASGLPARLGARARFTGGDTHSWQSVGSVPGAGFSLMGVLNRRWPLCTPSLCSLALGAAPDVAAMGRALSWSPAHRPRGSICRPCGPSLGSGWRVQAWLRPGLRLPACTGSVARLSCAAPGSAELCGSSSAHQLPKALGQPSRLRVFPPAGMPPPGCPWLPPAAREPRGAARVGLAGASPWLRAPVCPRGDSAPSPALHKVAARAAPAGMRPAHVRGRLFSPADGLQRSFSHARPCSARRQLHFCPRGAGAAACGTLLPPPSALLPSALACPSSAGSGPSCHRCRSAP